MICLRSVRSSAQTAYKQTTCGFSKMTDRQLKSTLEIQRKRISTVFQEEMQDVESSEAKTKGILDSCSSFSAGDAKLRGSG